MTGDEGLSEEEEDDGAFVWPDDDVDVGRYIPIDEEQGENFPGRRNAADSRRIVAASDAEKLNFTGLLREYGCFLEVVITTILCWRKIYPERIFVPRDGWGASVWQSAHPTLKEWIGRQVKEIVVGLFNGSIGRVHLLLFSARRKAVERAIFSFDDVAGLARWREEDIEFEGSDAPTRPLVHSMFRATLNHLLRLLASLPDLDLASHRGTPYFAIRTEPPDKGKRASSVPPRLADSASSSPGAASGATSQKLISGYPLRRASSACFSSASPSKLTRQLGIVNWDAEDSRGRTPSSRKLDKTSWSVSAARQFVRRIATGVLDLVLELEEL